MGNKERIIDSVIGDFSECADCGIKWLGDIPPQTVEPISRLQIQLLAPEYATTAMSRYGANCCICWKTWKNDIIKRLGD